MLESHDSDDDHLHERTARSTRGRSRAGRAAAGTEEEDIHASPTSTRRGGDDDVSEESLPAANEPKKRRGRV